MTREEFIEKFKVGDKIKYNNESNTPVFEILAIGKRNFFALNDEGKERSILIDGLYSFKLHEEPVKKDLEGLKKCYHIIRVQNSNVIWKLNPVWFSLDFIETMDKNNFITEEEAIERGLKI